VKFFENNPLINKHVLEILHITLAPTVADQLQSSAKDLEWIKVQFFLNSINFSRKATIVQRKYLQELSELEEKFNVFYDNIFSFIEALGQQDMREILPDQSLCVAILKIANSALYGHSKKISSLETAIVVLGRLLQTPMTKLDTVKWFWLERAFFLTPKRAITYHQYPMRICYDFIWLRSNVQAVDMLCCQSSL